MGRARAHVSGLSWRDRRGLPRRVATLQPGPCRPPPATARWRESRAGHVPGDGPGLAGRLPMSPRWRAEVAAEWDAHSVIGLKPVHLLPQLAGLRADLEHNLGEEPRLQRWA